MIRARSDAGLTMIELIVVVVLIGIMGGAITSIFINSWTAQNDVTTTTGATNRGQLIGQSIERAVRNAQAIDVSVDGVPSSDGTGTLLRVHTTQGGVRACQAFWFTGGSVYMTQTAGALPNAVSTSWPRAWQANVTQHGGIAFLTSTGSTVAYKFDVGTAASPVAIGGQVSLRAPTTGVTGPCW